MWAYAYALNASIGETYLSGNGTWMQFYPENFQYGDYAMREVLYSAMRNVSFIGITTPTVQFDENGDVKGATAVQQYMPDGRYTVVSLIHIRYFCCFII